MTVDQTPLWVLGYGSLIFKPPPHTQYRLSGYIHGFIRRFWQSSSDHRGTPESPGRVLNLVSLKDLKAHDFLQLDIKEFELLPQEEGLQGLNEDDLKIWGSIYYIPAEHAKEVIEYLDEREQDGYTAHEVKFNVELSPAQLQDAELMRLIDSTWNKNDKGGYDIKCMVYIGTIDNESFIGPESVEDTLKIVAHNVGPSGPNIEYLSNLVSSLRSLDHQNRSHDSYLERLLLLALEYRK